MRITGVKVVVYKFRGRPSLGTQELTIDPSLVYRVQEDHRGMHIWFTGYLADQTPVDVPDRFVLNPQQVRTALLQAGRTDLFR
jgi:hypothetical protein